jgi:hypothetical protein
MAVSWLKQPIERVHILLDETKAPSRVYIEFPDETLLHTAVGILHGMELTGSMGIVCSVSTPQELMRALFPSWQGAFKGSTPTLAGLSSEHIVSALQTGIITEAELYTIFCRICSPDSQPPMLSPLHSVQLLISILVKIPAFVDGHLFLPARLRDRIFSPFALSVGATRSMG